MENRRKPRWTLVISVLVALAGFILVREQHFNRAGEVLTGRWRTVEETSEGTWPQSPKGEGVADLINTEGLLPSRGSEAPILPASPSSSHVRTFGELSGIRYVYYDYWLGQFNNQLAALAQAMTLARIFTPNATLVLPPVKLGVESLTQFQKGREAGSEPLVFRIAGDLLDVDEIKKVLPVVQFDEFQSTTEGRRLSSSHLCVFDERFPTTPNTSKMIYENTYKLTKIETFDWKIDGNYCIKYDDRYIREAINCGQTKDALLLPKTFGGMTANCTDSFPALRKSLVHLIPRKELRRSVDQLFREIEAPVLGVHIRLINDAVRNCMKTEGGPAIVIKWMQDQFGSLFDQSRSIYVAFNPTDSDLVDIFQDMKNNFGSSKRVISCKDMVNCGHTRAPWAEELNINEYEFIFRNPYSSSLMDMWALASSDEFIGTRGSTFTTNVHRWRKLGTPELRYGGNENDRNYTRKDMCICNCGTTQNVH